MEILDSAHLTEEFTRAHAAYQKVLKSRALFKVHDASRCDDLVQTTFMKTWSYLMRGGKIEVMEAFLFHVLNGLIIDEYRKKKTVSLDSLIEEGFEPSILETERHIDVLDGKSALTLIGRLPHKYQEIMRLRYIEDLSLEEMSSITGESRNTLAVQVHRGLVKLRDLYMRKLSVG